MAKIVEKAKQVFRPKKVEEPKEEVVVEEVPHPNEVKAQELAAWFASVQPKQD